jgi:hypothetical protein
MTNNESSDNGPLEVIAGVFGTVCAVLGLVLGFREGGVGGAIVGCFLGGIGGAIATYLLAAALVIAAFVGGLGAVAWIISHFV